MLFIDLVVFGLYTGLFWLLLLLFFVIYFLFLILYYCIYFYCQGVMEERIETERCILRKVSVDDAEAIFSYYAQDDDVVRYLDWAKHASVQDTIDFLELCQQWRDDGKEYAFAILAKDT